MNAAPNSVIALLPILFVVGLAVALILRAANPKRKTTYADYHHWIVRSLAALIAVSAVTATAIGTWRGTGMAKGFRPVTVTIPTRAPQPLPKTKPYESIDLGETKVIGTVIVAQKEDGRFIPISSQSGVCDLRSNRPWKLHFAGTWQNSSYEVEISLDRITSYGDGGLLPQGGLRIRTQGPGWSSSSGSSTHPIGMLNEYELPNHGGTLQHAPLSLIPYDEGPNTCLLFHLERADAEDPLLEVPAAQWLETQSTAHLEAPSDSGYRGIRYDDDTPPGIRMLAYLGPSAFLLLIAATAASMCFRFGLRAPAFAGLTAAMVLYVGILDAMVLQRRANLMADSTKPETLRINAMSAISGTFFHAKRAQALIDDFRKTQTRK